MATEHDNFEAVFTRLRKEQIVNGNVRLRSPVIPSFVQRFKQQVSMMAIVSHAKWTVARKVDNLKLLI